MKTAAAYALVFALGALVALTGCESLFSGDAEDVDRETVLAEYGGFDTRHEAPAFGDDALASGYSGGAAYDDEMEDHREVQNAERRGARQYMLRVVWGNIDRPDSAGYGAGLDCPVTDWSGSLKVEGGVAVVRRLIRFEYPLDHIVRPRRGPDEVSWVSGTQNGLDGIVLRVLDVPDPAAAEILNSVVITTPFQVVEIPLAALEDYSAFFEIDECNKLSVVATALENLRCPAGFLEGGWVAETDTSGHFRGGWIAYDGSPAGYLRGRYTVRNGERVLYGKWITLSGDFGGLIRGTWQPAGGGPGPDGSFEARWVDELFISRGVLRGHYHAGPEGEAGFFHGRWRRVCR